ncbi:hypothetical protein G7Y89_g1288 [Cudoniella acicularis]|uniref:SRP9 domain-containing protein n=1 Tax=Cudoniella acicularis TaxID=354080 RepID=A0A8H4RXD5_9HELO|nr:hypothetical protein G7Y89_g1288 [Cudoniella acicularis]
MPYLETAQLWLTQSTLLLQARPSTVSALPPFMPPKSDYTQTRITTKYNVPHPKNSKSKSKPRVAKPTTTSAASDASTPAPVVATLTLKTYDPVSGTTLKYSTDKAAEVGRLIQILGRLARPMAGLPELKEDESTVVGAGGEAGSGVATPVVEAEKTLGAGAQGGKANAGGGAGGKKGKKKGKK